ncbi:LPS export ABC transporter periplasmic protein LptC [Pokkaliibacter sp. MBI-7]|uniref:LPS export ABC transporter periplasmic protein LptC n=1 Tax=Pokkaliibacter sp. MBI-7 TaxID=3040600 RepID=UPI0024475F83|nr:LPS export ABC transporter periplasmic protein LptC [Pokkaliibacter sp. MBI-7]MDH2431662.1 LPS export ABC transporter periplasmic protein LptC [Pokkaliibacter sp. MBI-7]
MSLKNRVILILAFVLIGIALLRYDLREPDQPVLSLEVLDGEKADSYATGITTERFDQNGQLASSVFSPRVDHFQSKGVSLLQMPDIRTWSQDGEWHTTARNGRYYDADEHIELENNVVIDRQPPQNPITMATEWLRIDSHLEQASTDRPVVITAPDGIAEATGMTADWASNRVTLLSQVRATYETAR